MSDLAASIILCSRETFGEYSERILISVRWRGGGGGVEGRGTTIRLDQGREYIIVLLIN